MLNRVQSGNLEGPEPAVTRREAGFPAPAVTSSGITSVRPRRTVVVGEGLGGGGVALELDEAVGLVSSREASALPTSAVGSIAEVGLGGRGCSPCRPSVAED